MPRGNGKDAFQKSGKTMRSPNTKSPLSTIPDESNVTKGEQTMKSVAPKVQYYNCKDSQI